MSNFELKAGMYVELANGLSGILVPWEGELSVLGPSYNGETRIIALCHPRFYEDDKDDDYGILKVYSNDFSNGINSRGCFSTDGRKLLYEYKVKELTVSEIEKLLGYKVKIVEG